MGQNNKESRLQFWAIRSSVCSFARTAHSFACSAMLASLARSAALTRSLAHSLRLWESERLDGYFSMRRRISVRGRVRRSVGLSVRRSVGPSVRWSVGPSLGPSSRVHFEGEKNAY